MAIESMIFILVALVLSKLCDVYNKVRSTNDTVKYIMDVVEKLSEKKN